MHVLGVVYLLMKRSEWCVLWYCRVAQSIGLANTGPDQVSEPKEVGYLTQRTSTDTTHLYKGVQQRVG
jgi:hypothetical protein